MSKQYTPALFDEMYNELLLARDEILSCKDASDDPHSIIAYSKQLARIDSILQRGSPSPTYKFGDRFRCAGGGEYILAQVDILRAALISLEDGNRYSDPVWVNEYNKITVAELLQMSGDEKFEKIK